MISDKLDLNLIGRLWFDSSAEALLVVDDTGAICAANRRSIDFFGYPAESLMSMRVEDLIPERYRKGHHQHRKQYAEKPSQRSMGQGLDLTALVSSGEEIPVEISMNRLEVGGEQFTMALISDISRRKAIEKKLQDFTVQLEDRIAERTRELKESQQLHEIIARHFPNGTINVLNRELNYFFAEGKELFKLGVTSERLIGTSYIDRLAPELRDQTREVLQSVFEGEAKSLEVPYKGNYYILDAVPLARPTGDIDRILVVEHNISQQKQAEVKMREALESERELGELKSRFVSMASHEFRTPLSSVLSSATILGRYLEKEEHSAFAERRGKHLSRIRSAVNNLNNILNDFLSLDKLESGVMGVKCDEINLKDIMEQVVEEMAEMSKPGQEIMLSIDEDCNSVQSDPDMLRNITVNLLSNAIKYSGEGKMIWLDVACEESLRISCKDEGIGIPKEEQKHLFDRFFRARNAVNTQGTGLGLNIVRRYLDLLGGTISFESSEEKGTTFFLEIPLTTK